MLTGAQFVQAVMAQLEVTSPAQLADAMGWKRGRERLVSKWLAGNNRPSYPNMLEMIEKAGWLDARTQTAKRPAAAESEPSLALVLRELRETVERQGEATTQTLSALEAQTEHIRGLLEPPTQEATVEVDT